MIHGTLASLFVRQSGAGGGGYLFFVPPRTSAVSGVIS